MNVPILELILIQSFLIHTHTYMLIRISGYCSVKKRNYDKQATANSLPAKKLAQTL